MQNNLWSLLEPNETPKAKGMVMNHLSAEQPRVPTAQEVEKLRLLLSTYQDGTGMLASTKDLPLPKGMTLPGWRDFERAVAAALGGDAQESKYVFDVVVPDPAIPTVKYGISCKMRRELNRASNGDGRITMELSNSAKQFWQYLHRKGITEANYRNKPLEVGEGLIELVRTWHEAESHAAGGIIDLSKSYYLVLSWNKKREYQLHQFSLELPQHLNWYFPTKKTKQGEQPADRLCGADETGVIFEWYGTSGGQLKYYPLARTALWRSDIFRLEPLPSSEEVEYGIVAKAKTYFPRKWSQALEEL
jgi:hypothetical protein